MGSFYGHLDSGIVFPLIGLWWTFNLFRDYRKCVRSGEQFRSRVSYIATFRNRRLPLEIFLKTLFPFVAILGELLRADFRVYFVDENNRFVRLQNLQHLSYFTLFLLHGLADMLSCYKVSPIMKEMKYLTASVAWSWLSIPSNFIIAGMTIWESQQRELITPQLIRCVLMLVLGIWSLQIPFILFKPFGDRRGVFFCSIILYPFLSVGGPNPAWVQTDIQNVYFVTALYGFDIAVALIVMAIIYATMEIHEKLKGLARRVSCSKDSEQQHECHAFNGVDWKDNEGHSKLEYIETYHNSLEDDTSFD